MEKICYHRVFVRFLPPVRDKALRLTQSNKKSNLIFTLFFFSNLVISLVISIIFFSNKLM